MVLDVGVVAQRGRPGGLDRARHHQAGVPPKIGQVADQLESLRDATEADELLVTTITHQHADRVRSFELLAQEWSRR